MPNCEKAKHISKCLELAILLEVSADKPGNVNFIVGFEGTKVEHFLASAVATAPSFKEAANRGIAVSEKKLSVKDVGMGQIIKKCVSDVKAWQKGGNTLLGTVILFVPIAVAAGMTPTEGNFDFEFLRLRENLKLAVESTTAEDAFHLYEAIEITGPSSLNMAPDLDVNDPRSKERILEEKISLHQVFKIAAGYDDICSEWVNNYPITFNLAYPYLSEQLRSRDLNLAIVHTFLKVLSEHPDTFIARKVGYEKAWETSLDAKKVLELGGLETTKGRKRLWELDRKLRGSGNLLNPGTTADIIAAALALCTLSGYRP
ncbi:MAG: triphosphoribosyl-dephospho-CoA synthase [Candidatus Bathyarchaeota archaeon]|nr:MAG: triphosphoribosyl-dephospho-CoA synthase [Candidatus Bathyarchaeota archaeon]